MYFLFDRNISLIQITFEIVHTRASIHNAPTYEVLSNYYKYFLAILASHICSFTFMTVCVFFVGQTYFCFVFSSFMPITFEVVHTCILTQCSCITYM